MTAASGSIAPNHPTADPPGGAPAVCAASAASAVSERAMWRAVAVPSEHGGWGLTLEPVLLGLLVAWSWAGSALGAAAFTAFLLRTPAKLVAVDRRRGRWLPRTSLALRIAVGEVLLVGALATAATLAGDVRWWLVVAAAAPLVAVEWWYDVRSHGRRLVPELCGATGVAATASAIALAGGAPWSTAVAVWMLLAARSVAAIPFVRVQIVRARRGVAAPAPSDLAQVVAVAIGVAAALVDRAVWPGLLVLLAIAVIHAVWVRHDPPAVKVIGIRQMLFGLALVAATAIGVLVP